MATLRRRYKGPTRARRCGRIIPVMGSVLPTKCGDKVYKAGVCKDHWLDDLHGRESRRGMKAAVVPWVKPEEAKRRTIRERRNRQGISAATQDWLIDRAQKRRSHK